MQVEHRNAEKNTRPRKHQESRPISLLFGDSTSELVRKRISYALQVFCAVFGYEFDKTNDRNSVKICYGRCSKKCSHIQVAAGYTARPPTTPASAPSFISCDSLQFPRFHVAANGETDWLGEIFEWISAADEQAIVERDSLERIPFSATLHGRYQLDPCVPYAAVAMHCLRDSIENSLASSRDSSFLRSPPLESHNFTIAATHDIDFLPVSSMGTIKRFLKNIAIAAIAYRDFPLVASLSLAGLRQLGNGPPVLDCLPAMLKREQDLGIQSTCNILCRQGHRRDANYRIDHPATISFLEKLAQEGVEIGLHGSYTSLGAPGRLAEEYRRLSQGGYAARGGRQHWLRYQDTSLFEELCRAGVLYDSSVGFSDRVGFRTGACFAYPPYNFQTESAFPLLELPLVLMDSALYCESHNRKNWSQLCQKVLGAIRRYGRGGVSILWHDTVFHGGQLPQELGDLYWTLKNEDENWTSALDLATATWPNFVDVGLLPSSLVQQHEKREVA